MKKSQHLLSIINVSSWCLLSQGRPSHSALRMLPMTRTLFEAVRTGVSPKSCVPIGCLKGRIKIKLMRYTIPTGVVISFGISWDRSRNFHWGVQSCRLHQKGQYLFRYFQISDFKKEITQRPVALASPGIEGTVLCSSLMFVFLIFLYNLILFKTVLRREGKPIQPLYIPYFCLKKKCWKLSFFLRTGPCFCFVQSRISAFECLGCLTGFARP